MKVAFTGGRYYNDAAHVRETIDNLIEEFGIFEVLVGDATGLDSLVKEEALATGLRYTVFYADWKKFGRYAGPIRNGAMLNRADLLVAFPGGKGTANAMQTALRRGVTVRVA